MRSSERFLKLTDEEFKFGLEFSSDHERALKDYLEGQDTQVGSHYFLGANNKKGPFMVVVEILT